MVGAPYIDAVQTVLIAATVSIVLFVIQYTLTSPWWKDSIGRTIVAKDLALLIILVPSVIRLFWRNAFTPLELAWLNITCLGLVVVIMVWRMVVWYKEKPFRRRK